MTRRADGVWEFTAREVRSFMMLLPLLTLVFAAGGAWGAVRLALNQKVDKAEYIIDKTAIALTFQSLHASDSAQLILSKELATRVQELVCGGMKRPACR